jgi:hypothetical protein
MGGGHALASGASRPDEGEEYVIDYLGEDALWRRGAAAEKLVPEQVGGERRDPDRDVAAGLAPVGGPLEDRGHDPCADVEDLVLGAGGQLRVGQVVAEQAALLNTIAAAATSGYLAAHGTGSTAAATVHGFTVAMAWGAGILLAAAIPVAVLVTGAAPSRRRYRGVSDRVHQPQAVGGQGSARP